MYEDERGTKSGSNISPQHILNENEALDKLYRPRDASSSQPPTIAGNKIFSGGFFIVGEIPLRFTSTSGVLWGNNECYKCFLL